LLLFDPILTLLRWECLLVVVQSGGVLAGCCSTGRDTLLVDDLLGPLADSPCTDNLEVFDLARGYNVVLRVFLVFFSGTCRYGSSIFRVDGIAPIKASRDIVRRY